MRIAVFGVAIGISACKQGDRTLSAGEAGPAAASIDGAAANATGTGGLGGGGAGAGDGPGGASQPSPPGQPGQPCAGPTDCGSSFCVDGVCCTTACDGVCMTCAAPGSAGACTFVPALDKPARPSECPADAGPSLCGNTGTCDGAGRCAQVPLGTQCTPQSCTDAVQTPAARCDGAGNCRDSPILLCAPYACGSDGACRSSCSSDGDCVNPPCVAGSCGVHVMAVCASNDECTSGFCVDGVCCDAACAGPCRSCRLVGKEGTCSPVPAGILDPRGICVDQGAATCGSNGRCDGLGACESYRPGTACSAARCVGDQLTTDGFCSDRGACVAAVESCAPFGCRTDVPRCHSSCPGGDTICVQGAYCSGDEVCQPQKPGGAPCGSDHECLSHVCAPAGDGGVSSCSSPT
ncbi:MAG TPA: hypothetical protein VMU50_04540 [Polyangia bacterium]|nr:hypothetical protein [Polyangia bacterium]